MGETLAGCGGKPQDTHRPTFFSNNPSVLLWSPPVFKHLRVLDPHKGTIYLLSLTRSYKITAKGGRSPSCAQPMTVLHVYEAVCAEEWKNWLSMLASRAGPGANCHRAQTPTLTFVRTVNSRRAPRFLVEAGAAAVAQLSAGVVLALALESGQKEGHGVSS